MPTRCEQNNKTGARTPSAQRVIIFAPGHQQTRVCSRDECGAERGEGKQFHPFCRSHWCKNTKQISATHRQLAWFLMRVCLRVNFIYLHCSRSLKKPNVDFFDPVPTSCRGKQSRSITRSIHQEDISINSLILEVLNV